MFVKRSDLFKREPKQKKKHEKMYRTIRYNRPLVAYIEVGHFLNEYFLKMYKRHGKQGFAKNLSINFYCGSEKAFTSIGQIPCEREFPLFYSRYANDFRK